ncbi:Brp/Blh family beta-carotene 15,15'-dioxygenase [Spirosoma spitsbergense]|uniref:Brp/Blh family beta-carotene 15,15'-dioxygenase n=1 Tax=Spirosoma spitsbergense TaxID=431554 RepID=UPI0003627C7F|nr:Brp/Blh family beta-carotene 15,15'-dioxygenase [Spirosoma spitsbergense]
MIATFLQRLSTFIQRIPTSLTILAGFMLAGYQYWVGPLSVPVQLIFCFSLLVLVGIPHGALDHVIEQEGSLRQSRPFSLTRFIIKYVITMAAYGLAWLFFPVLSLVLFLLISAWHFGETDIENAPDDVYWSVTRFVSGGFVLGFILLTHYADVAPIVARIVQNDPTTLQFLSWVSGQTGALLRGWATLGIVLAMLSFGHRPMTVNGWRLARLGIVLILTYVLPLLPAFMLYFGGWHSLSSFGNIRTFLQRPTSPAQSVWKLWRQSIPLTLLAVGFLLAGAGIWTSYTPQFDPLPYLFILLSTITLPHIQVMHQLDLLRK